MRALIAFFVDRSLLVNLLTVFVCVFGVVAAMGTPRALMPDGQVGSVVVEAELPGASAVDMERFVTFRIEEALAGMDDVERVTSTTTNGRLQLTLKLDPALDDIAGVLEDARSRISAARHRLPEDLRPVRIEERRQDDEFMSLVIEGVNETDPIHRRGVEALAERLARLSNVVKVSDTLRDMNLYVELDREALARAGLPVTLVRERLLELLAHLPVGGLRVRDQDIAVELQAPWSELDELAAQRLMLNRAGRGITLGDVATVRLGFADEEERRTLAGERYVELGIGFSPDADAIDVSQDVRAVVDAEAAELLPEGVTVRVEQDATEIISHELETLQGNGLGGIVIVLLILMLFLGWRVAAMTAIGLPFCYLGLVLVLSAFDIHFNLISLVAMILVVGILVDDAIIVSEEFCQRLAAGDSPREAAISAVQRVAKPVVGMVATTTVAFLPLLLLKSDASWVVAPLPIVIIGALFLSLFESFFLLPNHLAHFMKNQRGLVERRPVEALRRLYERVLFWVIKLRYLSAVGVAGLVAAAVALLMGPVEVETNLSLSGRASIFIELAEPASSLDELQERVALVEALVSELPAEYVRHYTTSLGRSWTANGDVVRGWKYAMVEIVPPGSFVEAEEARHAVASLLRPRLEELREDPAFARLRLDQSSGEETRDMVTVYVSGGDRIDFTVIQDDINRALQDVDGVQDVFMDEARFQRSLRFAVDDERALRYGLGERAIQSQLREHFARQELLRLRHRGEEIDVFLRVQDPPAPDPALLGELTVISDRGLPVPLKMIGAWHEDQVLRRIEHRDTLRMFQIDVLYDVSEVKAEEIADGVEQQLEPLRAKYPGYYLSVKPSEAAEKSKAWMLRLLVVCVGLIYLCLALALGSLVQPVVVIFAIPFGFIGVVLAFWLHGLPLGLMAIIGVLGLAGVVVNDSLVMAATINGVRAQSPDDVRGAIVRGAGARFRAVVLTSLTTLGGVFPLAYGIAGEAGWIRPMVLAVGWGLLFATALTLFFIPCLLMMIEDGRRALAFLARLVRRSPKTSVAPAD